MKIVKIVSGGQTGADRGGLDAAIELGIPHGGWCPKGRKAEDGVIPEKYLLSEMKTADYLKRTEQNVIDSDATVIFTYGKPTGGSKKTVDFCVKHDKFHKSIDLSAMDDVEAASFLLGFLLNSSGGILMFHRKTIPENPVLNIAGSRESKAEGIQERVKNVIVLTLSGKVYPMGEE